MSGKTERASLFWGSKKKGGIGGQENQKKSKQKLVSTAFIASEKVKPGVKKRGGHIAQLRPDEKWRFQGEARDSGEKLGRTQKRCREGAKNQRNYRGGKEKKKQTEKSAGFGRKLKSSGTAHRAEGRRPVEKKKETRAGFVLHGKCCKQKNMGTGVS